jgi:hypothetical protein
MGIPSHAGERLAFPRGTRSTRPTPSRRAGIDSALPDRTFLALITTVRSPFVARFYTRLFLPVWFGVIALWEIRLAAQQGWFGLDARIYYRGAALWLAGGNPADAWANMASSTFPFHYAAWPPMTIVSAPFTLLPEWVFVLGAVTGSGLAALYVVRRLGMPPYWLFFPPVVEGIISGNPSLVLLALLVSGSRLAQAIAPLLKPYAVLPLAGERRWKALGLAAGLIAVSLLAWPLWATYLGELGAIAARLSVEAGGGLSGSDNGVVLVLGMGALIALARTDGRAAGWLVVPALWPATQFHYSTLAMPVMHPILAMGLAVPLPGFPLATIAVYGGWRVLAARLATETRVLRDSAPAVARRARIPEAARAR